MPIGIIFVIIVYVFIFNFTQENVETTINSLLKDNGIHVSVDRVTLPYSAVIQSRYLVPVTVSRGGKMTEVEFKVVGYPWESTYVSISGLENMKLQLFVNPPFG